MTSVGRGEDAARYFQQALDIAARLAAAEPDRADYQRDLSISYNKLGDLMEREGDVVEAIRRYEQSLPLARTLADKQAGNIELQRDVLATLSRLAELHAAAGQEDAAARYREFAEQRRGHIESLSQATSGEAPAPRGGG
jgi:tetratricopeptide (TPR) repeat protein